MAWSTLTLFAVVAIVFARTAYGTITWWDSSSYSLAAATLGIASPPGSVILTLLGWPVAKLVSPPEVAHALNVFAALIASATVAMVCVNAIKVLESSSRERVAAGTMIGAAFGALLFASTTTLWDYAIRFTPYGLSALFTTVLLFVMLAWWRRADESNAWRLLVLLSFLFGVDFSVHRTNALLIPGALAWVLIRKPSSALSLRTIGLSIIALALGLSIQLLVIPMAARGGSPLNFSNPNSLPRLWDYVTLKQLGGGFLLNVFPRKSSVWGTQVADVAHILRDNFFDRSGPLGMLGFAPGAASIVGAIALLRLNVRLGIALLAVIAIHVVATILYFNIPANFFRSFDRHYLPICVVIGTVGAFGVASAADWATRVRGRVAPLIVAGTIAIVPIAQMASNYHRHDASRRFFAHDWATNALAQLPPNAVYLTVGDNDTFPVMYVQAVEGVRRDVTIINTSIATLTEWRRRNRALDPTFPLSATTTVDSIVRSPNFPRPIAYAITGVGMAPKDSTRFAGLHWLAASPSARTVDVTTARRNLLEISKYRGYADSSVDIDSTTPVMAAQYYYAMLELLSAERATAGIDQCRADRDVFVRQVPPERVSLPKDLRSSFESACGL
jgi:hypothetical protein